jgi:hypothetical protein
MQRPLKLETWVWIALMGAPPSLAQDSAARRLLQASEAQQIAFVKSALDRGMPPDLGDQMSLVLLNRSSLVVPLLEEKIEQVLKSDDPRECFTDKSVDPHKFVDLVALGIANVGDDEALKQVAKLSHLDEKRFGSLVGATLIHAKNWHNPFTVGYHGLAMGDPAVSQRIEAWVQSQLGSAEEYTAADAKRRWAEAMVDKYGGAPTEAQWASDPIVAGLKPSLAESLHNDVIRMAVDALAKRALK